ncbi:PREDICTED: probable BOI-related E3 ubiquitin-protein ligase 2 [Tarenaya hassleriana]|uniref:probable BOI-related E3 ubiquitin-protein ligase 2 n=1 Tax=Tarenaya hassleriana TaxID=28532 RepID=UPI00053C39A0|nr:PREDICTED: probable BOI-related E3 ubiquitin-protein ligase 2 [Tarenaya hassleriana]
MAFRHHNFQQKPRDSKNFRDLCGIDSQISPGLGFESSANLHDQSQHPPYIPPFHVAGFAPSPVVKTDGPDGASDLQWNYGFELRRKRIKEQDFLESNSSQISSIDFMQARSVSTGLGLSLDNARIASSDSSDLLSLVGDDIDRELQRQDAEIGRFLKIQGDQLRETILDKIQTSQLQTVSLMEEKVLEKLREKEDEVQTMNRKNKELEVRMEQLTMEAGAWQQRAKYNENLINALKYNLENVHSQPRDSKEGCGDSEVDDTASCFGGKTSWINNSDIAGTEGSISAPMMCKSCGVREVCMLLLPCKHLCLCKDCESSLSFCPLCKSSKFLGMEVYM